MPVAHLGGLDMVICGADGVRAVLDVGHGENAPASHAGDHCTFALTATGAPPVASASLAAPTQAGVRQHARLAVDLVPGRGLAAPPPPSHAPPRLI